MLKLQLDKQESIGIPFSCVTLIQYIKEKGVNIRRFFKIVGHAVNPTMSAEDFEEMLKK